MQHPPPWQVHSFKGNAGTVWDTAPPNGSAAAEEEEEEELLTVMLCGHADKIRMQVLHRDLQASLLCHHLLTALPFGHALRPCPLAMPFGHACQVRSVGSDGKIWINS